MSVAPSDRQHPDGDGPDPVSVAVVQAGLTAAADEMFLLLRRTAMSPIIHEVLDVGTGVTDARGNLVGSGAGIPTFVGVLDKAVQRIIELHGADNIHDGDLFITNDPYYGGVTHLNDVVVARPVFRRGSCIAWAASIGHWSDIGGLTAGSMSTRAEEIFQEGLRLPAVRLFERGHEVSSLLEIIAANSRLPDFVRGDLWAQIAGCRRAGERICRLAETYGLDLYHEAIDRLFQEGEQRSRRGLARIPQGEFGIEEEQDDGSIWKALIRVSGSDFLVDLRDNPERSREPFNTSRDGAVISAQMIFKALTDPELFANAGSFRPLRVLTRPGTIFDAREPTPHGYYFETRIRLFDLLWRCMARAMPDRLPAGHFGSVCGTVIAGQHPDTGRNFTMVEPQMGGWGATSERDGLDCMYSCSHGETFNCPAEICEARYGFDVDWKRMNDEIAGQGLHRGGKGMSVRYRLRAPAVLAVGFSRSRQPVWGSSGGDSGGTNRVRILRRNGGEEVLAFASDITLESGDRILVETANGGGWGRVGDD